MKRNIRCGANERRFTVIRVNGDPYDTHAARSFEQAWRLANPDRGARIDVYATCAPDAGAARIQVWRRGQRLRHFRYKGGR